MKCLVKNSIYVSVVAWMGWVHLFTTQLDKPFHVGIVPFPCWHSHKVDRISKASLDSDLLSVKKLTKRTINMFTFSLMGCTWLAVCGSTSSDFLESNKIGVGTNIWNMTKYQTWVFQNGTTIIRSALSCFTFKRTLGMTEIGRNA